VAAATVTVRYWSLIKGLEASVTVDHAEPLRPRPGARLSLDELARCQGVHPITSVDELACDVFATDEELDEFLAHTYAARRADLG